MKPLRLLAIIEAYSITGPAKNLLQFAQMAGEYGVETSLATFTRTQHSNLFTDTVAKLGIPLTIIPEQGLFDRGVFTALRQLTEQLQPDVIQTHAVKSHFLARCAGLHRHTPWAAFHHGYTWPTFRVRLYNQLDRWSLRAAHQVLTVSQPFAQELTRRGVPASNIEVVHNAIAPAWGTPSSPEQPARLREQWGIAPDRNVVLIVGRLSPEKDHRTVIDAVHRLPSSCKAHLVLVGDGPERAALQQHVQGLHMQNAVTFTGQQPSAEPFYAIAQAAVLSSLSEGSPNALLEAMAAGVPAVATRVGGIPEIVRDGESALLLEPRDTAAMGHALTRLLAPAPSDAALRTQLVARARQCIEQRHTPQVRTQRLCAIYRSLAKVKMESA
jgi:glycosyltransferase involved in cell wall biosynthesis